MLDHAKTSNSVEIGIKTKGLSLYLIRYTNPLFFGFSLRPQLTNGKIKLYCFMIRWFTRHH